MFNLDPRRSSSSADGDMRDVDGGYRVFYIIAVVCLSIFLFCVLAASVSVLKASAFVAMAALILSIAGYLGPRLWNRRRSGRRATAVLALTAARSRRTRAPRCASCAPADAPPAFAYVCPVESGEAGKQAAAGCVICSVCLEDVRGGEMVRQLPACGHVFHIECIDMWLQSHRTCPMCRCVISLRQMEAAKAAAPAPEEAPELSEESLPPV